MRTLTRLAICGASAIGCSKDEPAKAGEPPAKEPAETKIDRPANDPDPPAASGWASGELPSFRASFRTAGEATGGKTLTGTLYVGPRALRLDLDEHPNAGAPRSFVRVHGEDDLWAIDPTAKSYDRALSGDWEHDILPHVVEERRSDDAAKGDCPFGAAKPDACTRTGDGSVAGQAVEIWTYRGRTIAVAPALRVGMREEYTPFRNNPKTQVVELAELQVGAQDPALFTMPADYQCEAGGFCDSVPGAH
jgi:hypothetical protein